MTINSSTGPRDDARELIARRAGTQLTLSPALWRFGRRVGVQDLRRARIRDDHERAAPAGGDDRLLQATLIEGRESVRSVVGEARRAAQWRVRRIAVDEVARAGISERRVEADWSAIVTPGVRERRGDRARDAPASQMRGFV